MKATEKGSITKNYQWNHGKNSEGLYDIECLLCGNRYTASEESLETKKCPICQEKNK